MLDKLIINASVIDGSGAPCRNGSVGFKDGKLVMDPVDANAVEIIDAKGRVVCPGFIDPHSHGDRLIGTESGRLFKTVQGITTELAGNCGSAYAPVPRERADEIYAALGYVYPFDEVKKWSTFEKFLERVDQMSLSANARFYMGHGILRRAVMGTENRYATRAELDNMKALLREGLQAGAAGMSTGLIYVPGCYCEEREPIELAKVVAEYDGIYTSHTNFKRGSKVWFANP
jgi:N-acyl-D-amino-acid deacylase